MADAPNDIRARLQGLVADIKVEIARGADDRAPVELDQTSVGRLSRMDALRVQATAMAGQSRRVAEMRRLEAALVRLDAGDYGFCVACGEVIAPGRLALDPAAATCIDCANAAD